MILSSSAEGETKDYSQSHSYILWIPLIANKECLEESLLEERLSETIQFSFLFIS